MKRWAAFAVPAPLLLALTGMLTVSDVGESWRGHAVFLALPWILAGIGLVLGYFLHQSRVVFVALLLALVTGWVDGRMFAEPDPAVGMATVWLASVLVPVLAVVLLHLGERGVFNTYGAIRLAAVLFSAAAIAGLPLVPSVRNVLVDSKFQFLSDLGGGLRMPLVGVVAMAGSSPFFFIRREHDSPALGPAFFFAMLAFCISLSFRGAFWEVGQERVVLVVFVSAAHLILIWAVLESLWRNAYVDELTELPGRRALKNHMARLAGDYAMAVVDVDHFKKINDRHGHDTGDQVLRFVAGCLREQNAGKAYRYGGEEFVLICEGLDSDAMQEEMDQLRRGIHGREFVIRGIRRSGEKSRGGRRVFKEDSRIRVTVSIGLAMDADGAVPPQDVFKAADRALYRAKRGGRNRVCMAK